MARSKEAQVSRATIAMIGSGRVPLLYGSQKARNIMAAVQWATWRPSIRAPRRGRISRDRTNQMIRPESSAGARIHTEAVETWLNRASMS